MEFEKQKENKTNSSDEQTEAKQADGAGFKEGAVNQEEMNEASQESSVDEATELQNQLSQAQEEAANFKDRYLRTVAEMENMRKRHEKERSDLLKYGSEKVMTDLLPVLDSFDNAIHSDQSHTSMETLMEGVKMVQKQLLDVLEKHGLKSFEAAGQVFDPNYHQAIQRVEGDVKEDTVHSEFQKGYQLNDRLIRPAIVSVAVSGSDPNKDV
ncbi:MAG: nucleotide exchange factor GrpE [Oligoflexus sp.]